MDRCGLYSQNVLDRFDQTLDAGTDSLLADLTLLEPDEHGGGRCGRFNAALWSDLILPEDF